MYVYTYRLYAHLECIICSFLIMYLYTLTSLLSSLHCYVKFAWYILTLCSSSGVGDRISCISSLILRDSQVFSDTRSVLLLLASLRTWELVLRGLILAWLPDSLCDLVLSTPKLTVLPVIMEACMRGQETSSDYC